MEQMYKEKYKFWGAAIFIAVICILISNLFSAPDPNNQTVITVNAPDNMHIAFEKTLGDVRATKKYRIEFTDNANANFIVTEGQNSDGELIAYSPFISVFNSDKELYQKLIDDGIFTTSDIGSDYEDFDFGQIIDQILSPSGSDFKVYYPSKDSAYWNEFHNFLLFTINDGYYPKEGPVMENCEKTIEAFLNSKNAEPISKNSFNRINSIPQNSIYFLTYADLSEIYDKYEISHFRVMYPKTVVYHNYYANFDETGKILFDFMNATGKGVFGSEHTGFMRLRDCHYNTKYINGVLSFDNSAYLEQHYNAVEIPDATENNISNKEDK